MDDDLINFGNDEDNDEAFVDNINMDDLLVQWDGGGTGKLCCFLID